MIYLVFGHAPLKIDLLADGATNLRVTWSVEETPFYIHESAHVAKRGVLPVEVVSNYSDSPLLLRTPRDEPVCWLTSGFSKKEEKRIGGLM